MLFLLLFLSKPLLYVLVIYACLVFIFAAAYRSSFTQCSLYFPTLFYVLVFFFQRLLLRSGRRANGIARGRKGTKRARVGRKSNIFSFYVVWMTLWWCLFLNAFLLRSEERRRETFAQMQRDAGKGKETTARAQRRQQMS